MTKQLLLLATTALVSGSIAEAQIITRATLPPSFYATGHAATELSGVNIRYRSGGTDNDVGSSFTVAANTLMTGITVRIAPGGSFTLASNPTLRLDFFSVTGSGDPTPAINSSATADAITNYTFTPVGSVTGSMSAGDYGSLANGDYLTFDLSSLTVGQRSLVAGGQYAFLVGFDTQTASASDAIRLNAGSTGSSYSGGFEIRKDYEFDTFGRSTIETAALNRDLTFYVIPEPSTYAAIAGALALGLVAYRRRR